MKRVGNLWLQVIDIENLYAAARQAQQGKRFKSSVLAFNHCLEDELYQLHEELDQFTYQPGEYKTFRIFDPKPRLISAAPYRDRVVHHALCNVIMPIFDRTLISTTYANRVGYGSHRALKTFIGYARTSRYILQCDIRKYFPSIDLLILKSIICRQIKCKQTLWLIETIIDNSNEQDSSIEYFPGDDLLTPLERRRGIPIGNLTSQIFANVYLNGFDHYVKEELKCSKYLRYVDDFSLFSDSWQYLHDCRLAIESYLATLRVKIHPVKSQLFETKEGANFVGFRVLPEQVRVRNDNLRRARRRIRELQDGYGYYTLSANDVIHRLTSWEAHLKHGDTYRLRCDIFSDLWFKRYGDHPKAIKKRHRASVQKKPKELL